MTSARFRREKHLLSVAVVRVLDEHLLDERFGKYFKAILNLCLSFYISIYTWHKSF